MEYNKLIAELHTGDDVEGFYVLKDAFLKTTAAGKPFLSGVLADRSGVIDLKVWDSFRPHRRAAGRYRPRRQDPWAGVGVQGCAAADGGPHPHGGWERPV